MKFIIWLLIGIGILPAWAQKNKLVPKSTVVDFGTVQGWNNPPAIFELENTAVTPQYILAPKASRDVLLEYPKNPILPGEKAQIRVYYYTEVTGSFQKKLVFYASGSAEPMELTIKGNIKSLASNALTSCPEPGKVNVPAPVSQTVNVLIIDKETREPVHPALISFLSGQQFYANKNGKFNFTMVPGITQVYVQAESYLSKISTLAVRPNHSGDLIIELSKKGNTDDSLYNTGDPLLVSSPVPVDSTPVFAPLPDEKPEYSFTDYKANTIILLVDVSYSMVKGDKIGQLKKALTKLVDVMRSVDNVSLIAFANRTQDQFIYWNGLKKEDMKKAIANLQAKGSTNGVLGLERAFRLAESQFIPDGNNQVIIATDGAFNGSNTDEFAVQQMIQYYTNKGIKFTVLGFGSDPKAIGSMKRMAESGAGKFIQYQEKWGAEDVIMDEIKTNSRRTP